MPSSPPSLLFISLLLLSSTVSDAFSFSNYHTLVSLSHSITARIATLRAARGDVEGANRARKLAHNIEHGLGMGFYKFAWNLGWDYVKNYAWTDAVSSGTLGAVLLDLSKLLRSCGELNLIRSDAERLAWIARNYMNLLRVSKSILARLLDVFRQSGPLHEVFVTLQREVLEGDLLKDCLELSAGDLQGFIQVLKDIAIQYASGSTRTEL